MSFTGFGLNAIGWFDGLAADNSKVYFDRTRETWEQQVRDPLGAMLLELTDEFGGRVKLFRQNRDIRFSANKAPYKLNTYGVVGERPRDRPGLYASISAKGLYVGTGYYQMANDQLERYRAAVAKDSSGKKLEDIIEEVEAQGLELAGETLKTVPRGYPRDHARARLLAHKDVIVGTMMKPSPALYDRRALEHAAKTWRLAEPVCRWLDRHVGASTIPPEQRFGRR